jgi:hypothetical protein
MRKTNRLPLIGRAAVLACAVQLSACAPLVVGAIGGAAGGTAASVEQGEEQHHGAMSYVGSVLASTVYFPAKVLFAAGGAATSGVAYLVTLGEPEPSRNIWNASVAGDYIVTPRMIDGTDDVDFIGPG